MTAPGQGSPPLTAAANRAHAEALRFVLVQLDQADGLPPAVQPGELSPGAVVALASLVIGVRRAFAQLRGISDPADQAADVRSLLRAELESAELSVMLDDVAAEMGGPRPA